MDDKSPETLLTSAQVRATFGGISDMTLWRWLSLPKMCFPKPIYIARRRFWRESDIWAWIEAQQPNSPVA